MYIYIHEQFLYIHWSGNTYIVYLLKSPVLPTPTNAEYAVVNPDILHLERNVHTYIQYNN